MKQSLKSCRSVISVSEWTKKDLFEKLQIPENQIHVVRNGLEEKWFQKFEAGKSPMTVPFFLCLSNPKPHKNVKTLLSACQKLREQNHNFNLALSLGGGEFQKDLRFPSGYEHRIRVLKNLADHELLAYFTHARAVVSPSLYEGFDYPAAEGLALGRQVIISGGSAHDELKGEKLRIYGDAEDSEKLAAELLKCFLAPDDFGGPAPNNVPTLDEMVEGTLKVYEKA